MRIHTYLLAASLIGLSLAASPAEAGQSQPATATDPAAGKGTVFGHKGYIEYIPGNAPVIISAPHGGDLRPEAIPDRHREICGGGRTVISNDRNTQALIRQIRASYFERYGRYPHIVINRLARRKLDANRPVEEAACGSLDAEAALRDWHRFLDQAKEQVIRDFGKGWYIDLHGHGHKVRRIELGYLLRAGDIDRPDAALDADSDIRQQSSIRTLAEASGGSFAAILRGPQALGTFYAQHGIPAVPSAQDPQLSGDPYFAGGHNTRRHSCGAEATPLGGRTGGPICGVQIETHYRGLRDTPENRKRFAEVTAAALGGFLRDHYGFDLAAGPKQAVPAE